MLASSISLERTARVGAAAGDLHRAFRVLATLAAVFLVLWYGALAGGVRAFLLLCLSHGEILSNGERGHGDLTDIRAITGPLSMNELAGWKPQNLQV